MVKLVIIVLTILLTVSGVSPACGGAEYLKGQECCPMCRPGFYLWEHCTEFTGTGCLPCPSHTYTDAPSGPGSCTSCTVCDSSLRVKKACSSTSDTLCEPLEGHYCTDPIKDGCRGAVEHTKCSPGQYINQPGTASTDTLCGDCVGDTYSDGSFPSCRPHTQCIRLVVVREGSSSYDTDCGQRQNTGAIVAGIIAGVAVLAAACGAVFFGWRKRKAQQADTNLESDAQERLVSKLVDLGLNTSLCRWIYDFLTGRPQVARIGDHTSSMVITNTGTPQGSAPSCSPCSHMTVWQRTVPTSLSSLLVLRSLVRSAEFIIGRGLPALQDTYHTQCLRKACRILKDCYHRSYILFTPLPSGRRYQSIRSRTRRLENSFFPRAIRLLNGQ